MTDISPSEFDEWDFRGCKFESPSLEAFARELEQGAAAIVLQEILADAEYSLTRSGGFVNLLPGQAWFHVTTDLPKAIDEDLTLNDSEKRQLKQLWDQMAGIIKAAEERK